MKDSSGYLVAQGVIWWMGCSLERQKIVIVGDHVIVVGRVRDLDTYEGVSREQALLYSKSSYRLPGARIIVEDDARRLTGFNLNQDPKRQ